MMARFEVRYRGWDARLSQDPSGSPRRIYLAVERDGAWFRHVEVHAFGELTARHVAAVCRDAAAFICAGIEDGTIDGAEADGEDRFRSLEIEVPPRTFETSDEPAEWEIVSTFEL